MSADTRISEIKARLEKATTTFVDELAGFREFDAEWMANKTHRRAASPGGVRETFYAAGRMSGLADGGQDGADIAHLLAEVESLEAALQAERQANGQEAVDHALRDEIVKQQAARIAALEGERDRLRGWQAGQTHYAGCWREHRQCALATIDFESARRERAELALREAVEELNRLRDGQGS